VIECTRLGGFIYGTNDKKMCIMIPRGNLVLQEGDKIFMYSKLHLSYATDIEIYKEQEKII